MLKTLCLTLGIGLLSCGTSSAATIFTLDQDACTGTCGTAPFGTISLEQTAPGVVTVTETLAASEVFVSTGAGNALAFNVTSAGLISVGNMTPGFAIGPAPATASAFGAFLQSITCTDCQGGNTTNPAGPLSFTVTSDSGVTLANFTANNKGYYFASDILGANGNSGNVATIGSGGSVQNLTPEPASVGLLGSGLIALGFIARRKVTKGGHGHNR